MVQVFVICMIIFGVIAGLRMYYVTKNCVASPSTAGCDPGDSTAERVNMPGHNGCANSIEFYRNAAYLFVPFLIIMGLLAYLLRNVRDELNINRELVGTIVVWVVFVVPWLALNLYLSASTAYPLQLLVIAWVVLTFISSVAYPVTWSLSRPPVVFFPDCEIVNSLDGILHSDIALESFKEFLAKEFSLENLCFVLDVDDYRNMRKPDDLDKLGKKIYEDYIKPQSPHEVNISFAMRESVTQGMLHLNRDTFSPAHDEIYRLMESDSYQRFLKSNICRKLVAKLQVEETAGTLLDSAGVL